MPPGSRQLGGRVVTIADTVTADILDYLNACFGDLTGQAHTALGTGPYIADTGKYAHQHWRENHCAWPDEAERLAAALTEHAKQGDVYICPYLMWADKRTPGGAVGRVLAHADVDRGDLDLQKVTDLGGFAVASGQPGHTHVYVPLSRPVPANQHKALEAAPDRLLRRRQGQVRRQRPAAATGRAEPQADPVRFCPGPGELAGTP